jgi:hypothetical protein
MLISLDGQPEVIGLDCSESDTRVVRLITHDPPVLLERLTLNSRQDFIDYWLGLQKSGSFHRFMAEDCTNDPTEILPWLEQQITVERQFIKPNSPVYREAFAQLGIDLPYRRAGALALNKVSHLLAAGLTQNLLADITRLSQCLVSVQEQAARLYLALNSDTYRQAIHF